MKRLSIFLFIFIVSLFKAQKFSEYFEDKTLRLDYIFAGNAQQQYAFVNELVELKGWYGRKTELKTTPIQGDGQIKVYDSETQQLIYVIAFGTLFQEWTTLDEAKNNNKSFENTFLVPYPKKKIDIQVSFFDKKQNEKIILKHHVDPTDILIRKTVTKGIPTETIHKAKVKNPIYIAFLAEGYQEHEMPEFIEYSKKTIQYLFNHEIFNKYKDRFEFIAVKSPSKDSGITQPSKNIWKSTAVNSNFDTFYAERYLTNSHIFKMHNLLEDVPYQHIIILANTDIYGGGGILNGYLLATTKNSSFAPVIVHEFGHSFGALADEYFYENDIFDPSGDSKIEPWQKNITSLVDFESKWKHLVDKKTPIPTPAEKSTKYKIGAYEGLKGNGLYIPTLTCRMKINNTKDFCTVCSNALEEIILHYTSEEK